MNDRPDDGGTAPPPRPGRRKDGKRGGYRPAQTAPGAAQPPPDLAPPQVPQAPEPPAPAPAPASAPPAGEDDR